VHNGITAIYDSSGAGKTYLYELLQCMRKYNKNIITINYNNYNLLEKLSAFRNDIVVIDQYDEILNDFPQCLGLLNKYCGPVIIFGRSFDGLYMDIFCMFELVRTKDEAYLKAMIGQGRVGDTCRNSY
jgi:hypothetical protein